MDLLSDPVHNNLSKNESPSKRANNNNSSNISHNDWKSEEDYKREIIALEL